jgi:hypothetical protein
MTQKPQVKNSEELLKAINELELKIHVQEAQMKDHAMAIKEDLQPKNVIKNSFSYMAETPEIQRTLVNTVIGFAMGYAFKKAQDMMNEQTLDRLVHNVVDAGITKLEQRAPQSLVSKTITLLRKHTPAESPLYSFLHHNRQ